MNMDLTQVTDVELLSVERDGDVIVVQRKMTFTDGSTVNGKHVFPIDTLEWRAAEYEIDPADLDALLDIVIAEPFMEEPDQPDMLLYDAPTVDEARNYHLGRVGKVRARSKKSSGQSIPPDPVRERIKGMAVMNPEAVRLKREFVGQGREHAKKVKEEKAKKGLRALFVDSSVPEDERVGRLRAMLKTDHPTPSNQEKSNG